MRKFITLFMISIAIAIAGCESGGYYSNDDMFSNNDTSMDWAMPSKGGQSLFAISIATYNIETDAEKLAAKARAVFPGETVKVEKAINGYTVTLGLFSSESQAKNYRTAIRGRIKNELKTGAYQFISIVDGSTTPQIPADWHLLNNAFPISIEVARFENKPDNNYYNRKKDATNAVKKLRDKDYYAFLIHGPLNSRVYVGGFNNDDLIWEQNALGQYFFVDYGPRVQNIRKQFPYYYINGKKMIQTVTNRDLTQKISENYFRPSVTFLDAIEKDGLPQ